jgi:glycosyltransferase involved in cell wall biosynthesis
VIDEGVTDRVSAEDTGEGDCEAPHDATSRTDRTSDAADLIMQLASSHGETCVSHVCFAVEDRMTLELRWHHGAAHIRGPRMPSHRSGSDHPDVLDDAEPAAARLRIALVAPLVTTISEPQQGGSQAMLADLAVGLTAHGLDVDVYAATGSVIPGAHVIDTGIDSATLSGALIRHGQPRRSLGALDDAYEHVFRIVEREGYDVVHSHGFDPPALRRARAGHAPIIHTIHLPPEPEAAAALCEAQENSEPGIVVGVSASQARAWSSLVEFDRVIPNGVPVARIPWSDQPGHGLIFAGRLTAEKGASTAIEIALMSDERIDVYGTAYDEEYARALPRRHEGDSRVTFHEALPRAELWRRFASARAVLCPIDWDEPFGLVAAEAQAAGTPVVAFARGGLVEVVDDGVTGFLMEPGDVEAASAAVRQADTIDRRQCRQHAMDNLNLDDCLIAYEALYASVLAARVEPGGFVANG